MRLLTGLLAAILIALSLGGCLQADETVTIKADGSGTIAGSYVADLKKLKELIDMARMLYPQETEGQAVSDVLPNPFDRRWFEAAARSQKGLTITGGSTEEKDGVRTSTVAAKFTSLKAAAHGGAFFTSNVSLEVYVPKTADPKPKEARKPVTTGGGSAGGDGGDGDGEAGATPKAWKLSLKEAWLDSIGGMEPSQILPGFEPQLSTLKIVRRLTVPGKVLSTNGVLAKDGRTVTFTVDYKRILAGKNVSMEVVFEKVAGTALAPFRYAPDLMKLSPRFLKQPPEAKKPTTGTAPKDN